MRRKNKIGYKNRFGGALKFCRKPGRVIRQNYAEYCIYEIFIHISDNSIVVFNEMNIIIYPLRLNRRTGNGFIEKRYYLRRAKSRAGEKYKRGKR